MYSQSPAIILLLLFSVSVHAETSGEELEKKASGSISNGYVRCAAYFTIVSESLKTSSDTDTRNRYDSLKKTALNYSLIASGNNHPKKVAQEITLGKLEWYIKQMSRDIDHDIENMPLLSNQYSDMCMNIMEDPESYMDKITTETIEKHGP